MKNFYELEQSDIEEDKIIFDVICKLTESIFEKKIQPDVEFIIDRSTITETNIWITK